MDFNFLNIMKRVILGVASILMATVLTTSFNSCANEDPAEGLSIESAFTSKATITGYVHLNTNQTSDNVIKFVPPGTQLSFTVKNSAYGISSPGNYIATTTVGADGKYSIQVPATNDGTPIIVEINGNPVTVDEVASGSTKEKHLYELSTVSRSGVIKGFTYQTDLQYTLSSLTASEQWQTGTYKIKLQYPDDNFSTHKSDIISGTPVMLTVDKNDFIPPRQNDLVFEAKVGADGVLTIAMLAPTIAMNQKGLSVYLSSAVVLNCTTGEDSNGGDIKNKFIYTLNDAVTIYGGVDIDAGTASYIRGTQITNNQ